MMHARRPGGRAMRSLGHRSVRRRQGFLRLLLPLPILPPLHHEGCKHTGQHIARKGTAFEQILELPADFLL